MNDVQCRLIQSRQAHILELMKPLNDIYDNLIADDIFKQSQWSRIQRNELGCERRFLIELPKSHSADAFNSFLSALDATRQTRLAKYLRDAESVLTRRSMNLTAGDQPPLPTPATDDDDFEHLSGESLSHDSVDMPHSIETVPVPATSGPDNLTSFDGHDWFSKRRSDEKIYDMTSCKHRGHALIINNYKFNSSSFKDRLGWDLDSQNLKMLFDFLEFEFQELQNLTAQQMKDAIFEFTHDEKTLNASCTFVVLITHGSAEGFYGVDGCLVQPYRDVLHNFHRDQAEALIEKPKLFLFQACRGEQRDMIACKMFDDSSIEEENGETEDKPTISSVSRKVHPLPNMVIVNATIPGHVAWRDTQEGSWLITDFCRIVRAKCYGYKAEHVLDMITEVSSVLNDRDANVVQQIHTELLLNCKWYLFP